MKIKKEKVLAVLMAICMVFTMLPMSVFAAGEVAYIDANGETQQCGTYTFLTAQYLADNANTLVSGWYVVSGEVTATARITVSGDVHIILADGCDFKTPKGINVSDDDMDFTNGSANSLSIYSQSFGEDMGSLEASGGAWSQSAIGGDYQKNSGPITINGGEIKAINSGDTGAGIGSSYSGDSGDIVINGGSITAVGGKNAPAIGGCAESGGRNVTINGGEVSATGGRYGAAIGGGYRVDGGTITINGGTVTATGVYYGAGIGGGCEGDGVTITINGGTVIAIGGEQADGIGAGLDGHGGTFSTGENGNAVIAATSISDQGYKENESTSGIIFDGDIGYIYGNPIIEADSVFPRGYKLIIDEDKILNISEGTTITNDGLILNYGAISNEDLIEGNGAFVKFTEATYLDENGAETTKENCIELTSNYLYGSNAILDDGWYVVSGEVTSAERININGEVHIILADGCDFKTPKGINISDGDMDFTNGSANSLSIYSQSFGEDMGSLEASGGAWGQSAIGGDNQKNSGPITINGGEIKAINSGDTGAGIGSSYSGDSGDIVINGGSITAVGGNNAPAIGGCAESGGRNVTINGGEVSATGGRYGAAIGGGYRVDGGTITINGGTVTATGVHYGAGIGGGCERDGGTITINGGTVSATGGEKGSGIGGGDGGDGGTITVSGGTVSATGGEKGSGIGGGNGGDGGTFSTGENGNVFIIATSIADQSYKTDENTSGIIFDGNIGYVYGNPIIEADSVFPRGYKLIIDEDKILNISEGTTITNDGLIFNYGAISNEDLIEGNGAVVKFTEATYLDENGAETTKENCIELTSNYLYGLNAILDDGWYVVSGEVTSAERININGDVHLILADNCTLNAEIGIDVPDDDNDETNGSPNSLAIYAQSTGENMGKLLATGSKYQAGIGGGEGGHGGTITINGGAVTANGNIYAAGIGGGCYGKGGTITINGGIITATSGFEGAGIGGGCEGDGGTITVSGGTVTATSVFSGAGIGGGNYGNAGTFSTGENGNAFIIASSIADQSYKTDENTSGIIFDGNIGYIYGKPTVKENAVITSGKLLTIDEGNSIVINSGVTLTNNGTITNNGAIFKKGTLINNGTINGTGFISPTAATYLDDKGAEQTQDICTILTADYLAENEYTLTSGWYVVIGEVTSTERITINGDVHLILADNCTLNAESGGINVADDDNDETNGSPNSLAIYAQSTGENMGKLLATGGDFGAGIGGREHESGGKITINGGTVTATGGDYQAGIGGGYKGNGGTITVNGGAVTANGGYYGAGIGGGDSGNGGTITINGGTVTATGGNTGAGIGGGINGHGGIITLNGGNVTATGGFEGAGIGGGYNGNGGTITVNGGAVTATGGFEGAGIGGGWRRNGGIIAVNGGTVSATGGDSAAGIGGGWRGNGGTITVNGGNVTATGGESATGIGGGCDATDDGTFSTGENGNAVIDATSISDQGYKENESTSGIIFDGNNGAVYGDTTIEDDLEIPSGKTLEILEGSTLSVAEDATITNNGTIINNGTIANEGSFIDNGTFDGEGSISPKQSASITELAVNKTVYDGNAMQNSDVSYTYNGNAAPSVSWYSDNNGVIGEEIDPPTRYGFYWVKVSASETGFYVAAEATLRFEITHTHSWETDYSKNDTHHWHSCFCGEKRDYAAHSAINADDSCLTAETCECGYVLVAAEESHAYGEWTSNNDGTHTRSCTNPDCTASETENCLGGEATCTAKAVCEECEAEYGEMLAHSYTVSEHDATQHWHKCENCTAITEKENHSGGEASCTAKAVCEECEAEYGEMLAHSYTVSEHDATQHWHKCENCTAITEKENHSGGEATCTAKAVCEHCEAEYGEMLAHSYTVSEHDETQHWHKCENCTAITERENHSGGEATCTAKAVCEECQAEYGEMLEHVDADKDGKCDDCPENMSDELTFLEKVFNILRVIIRFIIFVLTLAWNLVASIF